METHFYCDCIFTVFLNFHPNRFFNILDSREPVWRSVYSNLQRLLRSTGSIFLIFFNFWNLISRIFIFQVPENRFWGLGTFLVVFYVQKIINLFTVFLIFYKFGQIHDKSWSYICSRQYGISPFLKSIVKKSKYL